jgi:hypothetical protein
VFSVGVIRSMTDINTDGCSWGKVLPQDVL